MTSGNSSRNAPPFSSQTPHRKASTSRPDTGAPSNSGGPQKPTVIRGKKSIEVMEGDLVQTLRAGGPGAAGRLLRNEGLTHRRIQAASGKADPEIDPTQNSDPEHEKKRQIAEKMWKEYLDELAYGGREPVILKYPGAPTFEGPTGASSPEVDKFKLA